MIMTTVMTTSATLVILDVNVCHHFFVFYCKQQRKQQYRLKKSINRDIWNKFPSMLSFHVNALVDIVHQLSKYAQK